MPSFIDKMGARQQVTLGADTFKAARDANLTVRQYLNTVYKTSSDVETFKQLCASENLFFSADDSHGLRSTPLRAILDPPILDAAETTRESPVQSRILFPAALMSYMEDVMAKDRMSPISVFDSLVALTTTVNSKRIEQPVISYSGNDGPEEARSQQIAQLSEPANMMVLTASDTTRQIPTFSLGLAVSDEVMDYATIDLVSLSLMRQKEVELFLLAGEAVLAMLNGDDDNGDGALTAVKADTFDSTISAAGTLTHKAWILWLYNNILQRRIDWVVVDSITTAMAVENRTGKPVITTDDPNSPRIDTLFNVAYPNIAANVQMFIAPTEWSMPANTIMGIQSNSAIAKLVNANAEYEATERWALRKGEAMRFDFGQQYYRLYDEAFSVLSLTLTT